MKKILLLLPVFFLCISANAQKFIQIEDKAFNFGAKVGVNSTFPIVNSLTIEGRLSGFCLLQNQYRPFLYPAGPVVVSHERRHSFLHATKYRVQLSR